VRDNQPIADREVMFPEGKPLISQTGTDSRITFVNKEFASVSGFSRDELLGAPHNLVRHPHMPAQAFANLWATIKEGRPWEGSIENRTKTGDRYWVRANVTPVTEDGAVKGYISIYGRPSREKVAEAEAAYKRMRAGDTSLGLRDGELIHTGWRAGFGVFRASVTGRLVGIFATLILGIALVGGAGLLGMAQSNESLRTVYEDRVVPLSQLGEIMALMQQNSLEIGLAGRKSGRMPRGSTRSGPNTRQPISPPKRPIWPVSSKPDARYSCRKVCGRRCSGPNKATDPAWKSCSLKKWCQSSPRNAHG
jgi:aerotaxis receptor